MNKKILFLILIILLFHSNPVSGGITIDNQPGNVSFLKSRTQALRKTYKTTLSGSTTAIQAIVVRTPVYSMDDSCSSGSSSGGTISGGRTWWGGDFIIDIRGQVGGWINIKKAENAWANSNYAFNTDTDNPYMCILLQIKFVGNDASKWSKQITIKIYEKEVPEKGILGPSIPFYTPIIALAAFVIIKRMKR